MTCWQKHVSEPQHADTDAGVEVRAKGAVGLRAQPGVYFGQEETVLCAQDALCVGPRVLRPKAVSSVSLDLLLGPHLK